MTIKEKLDAVVEEFGNVGIVPVIKLDKVENAEKLAKALRDGGINCAEVTFRAKGADEVIRRMTKAYPDMFVGAGTVLTCEQADAAYAAGAKFCVAPGLNPKVVKHCLDSGIPFAPGLSSASEIEQALELGLDFVKFFPAEQAGGLQYIKAVCGPYTTMRFMPTGGINPDNLNTYLSYNKIVCCGGSWIVPSKLLDEENWEGITALCKEAIAKMLDFKVVHVGINCKDAAEAESVADKFDDAFGFAKFHHLVDVTRTDRHTGRILADAAVAGRAPDLGAGRALFQGPDDGVFAAAAAYDQNFHRCPPLCRISDGTAAARRRPWQCRTCCRCR